MASIVSCSIRGRLVVQRVVVSRHQANPTTLFRLFTTNPIPLVRSNHALRNYSPSLRYFTPVIGCVGLNVLESRATLLEAAMVPPEMKNAKVTTREEETIVTTTELTGWKMTRRRIQKTFRLWKRFIKLCFTLAPVAALYPLQKLLSWWHPQDAHQDDDVHDVMLVESSSVDGPLGWYLTLCLYCVECSGAAVVKLMQWAGSRPDLFGRDFCGK